MIISSVQEVQAKEGVKSISAASDSISNGSVFTIDLTEPTESYIAPRLISTDTKAIMEDLTQEIGISRYVPTITKDNNSMIVKSQNHLIDMIKYYEGDNKYYYEAKIAQYNDCKGTATQGFGHTHKKKISNQDDAYSVLAEDLKESAKAVKTKLGDSYNKLPNSVREALIDLAFNKGPSTITDKIVKAAKENDYKTLIQNLQYIYSAKDIKKENPEAGLYRRSLSRMILATRDLTDSQKSEVAPTIEKFYQEAKNFYKNKKVSTDELDKIYEQYSKGTISTKTTSVVNNKILVDDRFATKGFFAIVRTIYDADSEAKDVIPYDEYLEQAKKLNKGYEKINIGEYIYLPCVGNNFDLPEESKSKGSSIGRKIALGALGVASIGAAIKGLSHFFGKKGLIAGLGFGVLGLAGWGIGKLISSEKSENEVSIQTGTVKEPEKVDETIKTRDEIKAPMVENGKVVATRKYFETEKTSGPLYGKTIIVNAGHGYGNDVTDCGTLGMYGLEDEWLLNYDNSMRLIKRLNDQGANVIFLQGRETGDSLISNALSKSDNKADMFISVHVNALEEDKIGKVNKDRMEILVAKNPSNRDIALAKSLENLVDSENTNQEYASTIIKSTQVLTNASKKMPAILWEPAFMNIEEGADRLRSTEWCEHQSDLLCQSIVNYFENNLANDKYYIIKSGDNLSKIANKYGISIESLREENNIIGSDIKAGQILKIPK